MAKCTPKVIKNDVEKPSIWRSSKNQLFDSHNDHYLDTSEPLNSQRILYNKGSLKNVRLGEEKELGICTAQPLWVNQREPETPEQFSTLAFLPLFEDQKLMFFAALMSSNLNVFSRFLYI